MAIVGGNFERAGTVSTSTFACAASTAPVRAAQELVRDVVVEARLDDEDAGARHGRAGSDFGVRCDHEATGSAWQDLILRRAAGSSRRIVPAL